MGMAVDVSKEIRRAVDTGKVLFGWRETEKTVLGGSAKLVIVSSDLPAEDKEVLLAKALVAGIPVYAFTGSAVELGSLCGKPHTVRAMAVLDEGKSKVLEAAT